VTGDVTARQKLELRAGSKVTGNIRAPRVVVEEGAHFEGQCSMGAAQAARQPEKTERPSQPEKTERPSPPVPFRAGASA
jgi:cytoskeletal protein CcmA (bactofilin family)